MPSAIRRQQAICRSAELGAAALAIAPDPAVTPGAQDHHQHCQILSLVHGYEDPSEADAEAVAVLLYRLGMARMVELINRANDERKPELREPVPELVA
jgi:hypothetical protein